MIDFRMKLFSKLLFIVAVLSLASCAHHEPRYQSITTTTS